MPQGCETKNFEKNFNSNPKQYFLANCSKFFQIVPKFSNFFFWKYVYNFFKDNLGKGYLQSYTLPSFIPGDIQSTDVRHFYSRNTITRFGATYKATGKHHLFIRRLLDSLLKLYNTYVV